MGGQQRCIKDFGMETEGRSPLLRPRLRQEDNIKMDVQEVESGTDWNHLAQDRD
jgi:hypothetical protein